MSLATPSNIRELQIKLYRKAKNEPGYRFYMLYDKIYREDILAHAYALARTNQGAPGVDGQTFEQIESAGVAEWLTGIREELRNQTYKPQPVRRVMIPKAGGGERPLGMPINRKKRTLPKRRCGNISPSNPTSLGFSGYSESHCLLVLAC